MKKLDLIIIGAQKSGTTSLNNYLRQHPDISGHSSLEFAYFADDDEYSKGYEHAANEYLDKKIAKVRIAKNVTISFREEALKRLKEHNPHAKIVLILREPVSRAYSEYTMAVMDGWMKRSFSEFHEILDHQNTTDPIYQCFIPNGFYASQIKLALKYFPEKNVRIFLFDDLKKDPIRICDHIFKWLNISSFSITPEVHNRSVQPRSMRLASLTHRFRKKNNPLKKALKALLPRPYFERFSNSVMKANASNASFPALSEELKVKLVDHYRPSIKELVELIKGSDPEMLVTFGKSNWLNSAMQSVQNVEADIRPTSEQH